MVMELTILEVFLIHAIGLVAGALLTSILRRTQSPHVIWRKETSEGTETVTTLPEPERPDNLKARRYLSPEMKREMQDQSRRRGSH